MKILPNGIAVIEDDTHVSKWVEQHGTLRIAEDSLRPLRKYIRSGDVVVDAGAMIGDHTATYADWVGPQGIVYAFEPNHAAYECLLHNTLHLRNVICHNFGLSDTEGTAAISLDPNAGASHLSSDGEHTIGLIPLDNLLINPHFIKIDVEGYEVRVLRGAKETISRSRPVMLIEVNAGALERAGTSRDELLKLISTLDYRAKITDNRVKWSDPQYDIICIPMEKSNVG